jgi:uncharacterized cupredoxin-like copper-binding protein
MKVRTLSVALLVLAFGLVLAPAAISKPAASQASTVLVTAKEFKFTLSKRTVPKGIVTFKVKNSGALPPDFKISGKKTAMIKPGKTVTLKVTLSKGAKAYICTVPGHAAAGMKGSLRVT